MRWALIGVFAVFCILDVTASRFCAAWHLLLTHRLYFLIPSPHTYTPTHPLHTHIPTHTPTHTYTPLPPTHIQVNRTLPDRIIVFRDGVGDGQMSTVTQYEVPQISSCFSMFGRYR